MSTVVLGVRIDTFTKAETLKKVSEFLIGNGQHTIFTPNPEMLVKAQKDEYFKEVLNRGDLNLCDGFGLWVAMILEIRYWKLKEKKIISNIKYPISFDRVPGTDFMLDVCRMAAEQGKSVYLLGSGNERVVQKTAERLRERFPGLKIAGGDKGPNIQENKKTIKQENTEEIFNLQSSIFEGLSVDKVENKKIVDVVNNSKAEILFVAFGMGKQEKWIVENLNKLPSVKIAMGVGGAFDYISGKVKRAPLLMRRLGLEWMYRLFKQPQRAGRIFNATVRFI